MVELVDEGGLIQRHEAARFLRRLDPDEARLEAGKWDGRERAGRAMELARDAIVRTRVMKARCDGALRIGARTCLDAGLAPAERAASVRADDEAGGDRVAAAEFDGDALVVRLKI